MTMHEEIIKMLEGKYPHGTLFYCINPISRMYVSNGKFRYNELTGNYCCTSGGEVYDAKLYPYGNCFAQIIGSTIETEKYSSGKVKSSIWKKFLKKAADAVGEFLTNAWVVFAIGALVGALALFSILLVIFKF